MALRKLRDGVTIIYSLVISIGIVIWAALYIILKLYLPIKWRGWRASLRFKRILLREGMPKDAVREITKSQFKTISLISIWRWWRHIAKRKRRKGGKLRGEAESLS